MPTSKAKSTLKKKRNFNIWSFENIKLKSTPKIRLKPSHTIILRYPDNKTKKSYDIDSLKGIKVQRMKLSNGGTYMMVASIIYVVLKIHSWNPLQKYVWSRLIPSYYDTPTIKPRNHTILTLGSPRRISSVCGHRTQRRLYKS